LEMDCLRGSEDLVMHPEYITPSPDQLKTTITMRGCTKIDKFLLIVNDLMAVKIVLIYSSIAVGVGTTRDLGKQCRPASKGG